MGYVCLSCGNCEEFWASRSFEKIGYEDVYINHDGEIVEVSDDDITDSSYGELEDIYCSNCSSQHVRYIRNYKELVSMIKEQEIDNDIAKTIKKNYLEENKNEAENIEEVKTLRDIFSEKGD